ncbi:MAG: CoA transferase [Rhizobiaceae bacterium]|nr:CoA transferase [Rhizobiaceae bacterium]
MSEQNIPKRPLEGYRILDLTSVVLGPYCTQLLGDLGADVIKIESPDGDIMRHAGPMVSPGMGPIYLTINRNKRAMTLDLKQDGAKAILRKLIENADGIIHNIRAGGMRRLGFDYDNVKTIKPDIIYCHAVGYGSKGHYAERQAYDDLVQAASGAAFMIPQQDGSTDPRYFPGLVADKTTGLHAAYAMLAAFMHRERTGEGQFVEVPMMECMVSFTMAENLYGHAFVPPREPIAYTRSINPNRKPYKTKDGYIAIMPYSNANWENFLAHGGRDELMLDPRYSTYEERTKNITDLYKVCEEVALLKTTDEWMDVLASENVPCMRVHTLKSVLEDPQISETGFLEEREHPSEGRYTAVNNPISFSGSPVTIDRDPPLLGEHNREIALEIGLSESEINQYFEEGVFG